MSLKVRIDFSRTLFARFSSSDYYLFTNLKKWVSGKIFGYIEDVKSAVDGHFEELHGSYFKQGIETMEHRWEKCKELKRGYVEK